MELEELLSILTQFPDSEQKKELISKAEGLNAKVEEYKQKYENREDEEAISQSKILEEEINEYSKIVSCAVAKLTDELKKKIKKTPKIDSDKSTLSILRETYATVLDKKYENFEKAVSGLEYSLMDIINLTQYALIIPDNYGLYISALINKIIKPEDIIPLQITKSLPYIGYKLKCGTVLVKGSIGYGAGEWMTGGRLEINGHVGDGAGRIMTGGELIVKSNTGDNTGYQMTNGKITILGKAKGSLGVGMKNGVIDAMSDVGDYVGRDMINGKIIVHGKAGKHAGQNMQGGLLELKSDAGDELGEELNGGHIIVRGKAGKNIGLNRKLGIIELLGGYESIGYTHPLHEAQIHIE